MIRYEERKSMKDVTPAELSKAEAKTAADRKVESIDIESIEMHDRLRAVDGEAVERLAVSIDKIGLRTPISVRYYAERPAHIPPNETDDALVLMAGAHRLAAAVKLGWEEIECFVYYDDDDIDTQLWEIDENLMRAELSPSERAVHIARRKEIYEALHPETKAGLAGAVGKHGAVANLASADEKADRFTADTAKATGQSERAVQRDAERGTKVISEALDLIRGTKLDTGTYLDKLKKMPGSEQFQAAKRDLADTKRREKDKVEKAAKKAKREAKQAENDRRREEHAAALPRSIKDHEAAKAEAIAARKTKPVDVDALTAENEELREANVALEAEVAALKADNAKWEAMRVQFEQGGFEKVIAGKDEEIRGLESRLYRESADKASWMRSAKSWQAKAIELGYSNDTMIDIETCEVIDG